MAPGDGCVVVAGVFPAGTACNLVEVAGPEVLRAEGGEWLGARVADDAAVVGFDGLEVGGSYFVTGYVGGELIELRAKGHRPEEVNEFLSQPPIVPARQTVGTQEAPLPADAPAVRSDLEVGLPASLVAQVPTPESEAASTGAASAPGDGSAPQSSDAASASQVTPSESSAGASASEPAPAADSSGAAPAEGAPADSSAAGPAATDASAPSAWDQLLAQANGLDVPNADALSDEELRQAITDKGATPVA